MYRVMQEINITCVHTIKPLDLVSSQVNLYRKHKTAFINYKFFHSILKFMFISSNNLYERTVLKLLCWGFIERI